LQIIDIVKSLAAQLSGIGFSFTPPPCFTGSLPGPSWEQDIKDFFEVYYHEFIEANERERAMREKAMHEKVRREKAKQQNLEREGEASERTEAREEEDKEEETGKGAGSNSQNVAKPPATTKPRVFHHVMYSSEPLTTLMVRILSWFGPQALRAVKNNAWASASARSFCATVVSDASSLV
jgi:hypothetical protein